MGKTPVLKGENLQKIFHSGKNQTQAVQSVSLEFYKGESVALTGPSGCGKTTLMNMLGLVLTPSSGKVVIGSTNSNKLTNKEYAIYRNKIFGYVVQDFALVDDDLVYHNVEIPLIYAKPSISKEDRKNKIINALKLTGIEDKIYEKAKTLSGGQRQRVAIARAIVNDPQIILADEPTGALDSKNALLIFNLLQDLVSKGKTLIMATHNAELASLCNREIKMLDGKILP